MRVMSDGGDIADQKSYRCLLCSKVLKNKNPFHHWVKKHYRSTSMCRVVRSKFEISMTKGIVTVEINRNNAG